MLLGIPKDFFYYNYISFINTLFDDTAIRIVIGEDNDEETLTIGTELAVDEACLPIKLFVGHVEKLCRKCDKVLVVRIMKDYNGRWLCPKLLGLPELASPVTAADKLLITDPVYFNNKGKTKKALWRLCKNIGVDKKIFERNFEKAYSDEMKAAFGIGKVHIEADWEFMPDVPSEGEIILPNTKKVLLLGHCYNIYDRFANGNIMKKLDELAVTSLTESCVSRSRREDAIKRLKLEKSPFWEAFVRNIGTAVVLKDKVDGIIYLSSFSCGPDAFIIEMLKDNVKDVPIMIIKLDEHRGEAGFETRLEAFNDLMEKRRLA